MLTSIKLPSRMRLVNGCEVVPQCLEASILDGTVWNIG